MYRSARFAFFLTTAALWAGCLVGVEQARADDADLEAQIDAYEVKLKDARKRGQYVELKSLLPPTDRLIQQLRSADRRATSLAWIADYHFAAGNYARVDECLVAARPIVERMRGPTHPECLRLAVYHACALNNLYRYVEAKKLCRPALDQLPEKDTELLSFGYHVLAYAEMGLGEYANAIASAQHSVAIVARLEGPESEAVASRTLNLIQAYHGAGEFAQAITHAQRAVAILEKLPQDDELLSAKHYLAHNLYHVGRRSEAEAAYRALIPLNEARYGADSPNVANVLNNLAQLYGEEGRDGEQEVLYRRAIGILSKTNHNDLTESQLSLAQILVNSHRIPEALELIAAAQRRVAELHGKSHPDYAEALSILGGIEQKNREFDKAAALHREAIEIYKKRPGVYSLFQARVQGNLASIYLAQQKYPAALEECRQAQQLIVAKLGPLHNENADILQLRAKILVRQGDVVAALDAVDEALQILESTRGSPHSLLDCFYQRALINWEDGRKSEALADLRKAMTNAEEVRVRSAGAEQERAHQFEDSLEVFETMLRWQMALGANQDLDECLAVIDRCRARSLIDELNCSAADLFVARTVEEKKQFADRTSELQSEIARLERRSSAAQNTQEQDELSQQIAAKRDQLYALHREARMSSDVYRRLLSASTSTTHLRQFQRQLREQKGLALVYFSGEQNFYLLCIDGMSAELHELAIDATQAKELGLTSGPLQHGAVQQVVLGTPAGKYRDGLLYKLQHPKEDIALYDDLRTLWNVLIPEKYRGKLLAGDYASWLVVPDGALCLCPFEALITNPDATDELRFAIDDCPPITYTPSVNVFTTLRRQAAATPKAKAPAALSISRPQMPVATVPTNTLVTRGSGVTAAERYRSGNGLLGDLPHTQLESNWLCSWLQKAGFATNQLTGPQATEDAVRQSIAGKQLIHFACHGLVDNRNGNFFGALALAKPAAGGVGSSDGFLTLAEIYSLDLSQCELAVLSACQTNAGPTQRAEGVWSLSRGFLGAGSKRVVANNWLVDDQASSILMSYFASGVAKEWQNPDFNYGVHLRNAKRDLRKQEKYEHPFYWAALVLIGTN